MKQIIDFLGWLQARHRHEAIYRGHANGAWHLTPSAFRVGEYGITTRQHLADWRHAAARTLDSRPQSDFEWLVLAQHYGIATGLLDWTTNPLVAFFFACSEPYDQDGCVIQFARENFQEFKKPESITVFSGTREKPALLDASAMNARTKAQDSVMSLHYGAFPTMSLAPNGEVYGVPAATKALGLIALSRLGISSDRMFPDLTVAAQRFKSGLTIAASFSQSTTSPKFSQRDRNKDTNTS